MTNHQEMVQIPLLERVNVKKTYYNLGIIVFVISVIESLSKSQSSIAYFVAPNLFYHLIFRLLSNLPNSLERFGSQEEYQTMQKNFKVMAYFLIIFSCMVVIPIALNLLISDYFGALGFFPAFAFGLGGIKIYQNLQEN